MRKLTIDQARRAALAAQGFGRTPPSGNVNRRHFHRLFEEMGLLQLDSVNVFERSHYIPVFARLGPYSKLALDDYTIRSGEVFEYWGHAASLIPMNTYPRYRHRMARYRPWKSLQEVLDTQPGYVEEVYQQVDEHGPLTVGDLPDGGERHGPWWGYGKGKMLLEWLFVTGRVAAYRDHKFAKIYDLPERVIPASVLKADPVPIEDAYRLMLAAAARHHAVGTVEDLADYYRLHMPTARPIAAQMAAEGKLVPVEVEGWSKPALADPDMRIPRSISGSTILSPFDPIVWARDRVERLFGFHYRIEIYVPKPKRTFGYYVLPFLLDGELVARVDLKTDRQAGTLRVLGSFVEPDQEVARVRVALLKHLSEVAEWLGMAKLEVVNNGNLSLL